MGSVLASNRSRHRSFGKAYREGEKEELSLVSGRSLVTSLFCDIFMVGTWVGQSPRHSSAVN